MILNQKLRRKRSEEKTVTFGFLLGRMDTGVAGRRRRCGTGFGDASVGLSALKVFFVAYKKEPWHAGFIEKLAASGGSASWFQTGVSAERRRRQLPIRSGSARRRDGWGCHAPSPCRCNWGFSCCDTTRFVFPRGGGLGAGGLKNKVWRDGSLRADNLIWCIFNFLFLQPE